MQIAVLVSGSGTLLEAMLRAQLPVALVVSDRPCRGLTISDDAGIQTVLVERSEWGESFQRDEYSQRIIDVLHNNSIDLVAMAGFGTVLGEDVFDAMSGRVVNTHPALLPSFPGWHGVRDALAYGVKITGCTIHVATPEVDNGPILAQAAVEIRDDDTEATLHERIKTAERQLYIDTLKHIVETEQILGEPIAAHTGD